ncbi:MAG: chromosomal replication initiator DnaA [Epsilonproteobacteria bacterium]|nr:chromosomal replication initiator DnaA [Campylobacterota bacterium]
MARALRLSFEDAFYHITARGIRKENIFYSDKDKDIFIDKMNETFEKYSFICHAYCLMDNHYHLFLRTPFANISGGMHFLNASYASRFRAKHKLIGPIFQGRYKSILVDEDSYALILSAYIHLNPIRAGITEKLENYPYSSFLDYVVKRKFVIKRLNTSLILNKLSNKTDQAQKVYREFVVKNEKMKSPAENVFKGIALGSDKFIEKITEKIKLIGKNREIKETKLMSAYNPDEIIKAVLDEFNITTDELFKSKRGNVYRQLALYLIKKYTASPLKEIGKLFNMDYTSVSVTAKRFREKMDNDKKILEMIDKITEKMKGE